MPEYLRFHTIGQTVPRRGSHTCDSLEIAFCNWDGPQNSPKAADALPLSLEAALPAAVFRLFTASQSLPGMPSRHTFIPSVNPDFLMIYKFATTLDCCSAARGGICTALALQAAAVHEWLKKGFER